MVSVLTIGLVIIGLGRILLTPPRSPVYPRMPKSAVRIDENVGLSLDFRKTVDGKNVTLEGTHNVLLVIAKSCPSPRFILRLIGQDALFSVPIIQLDKFQWKGAFQVPFIGYYVVEPRWYGCDVAKPTKDYKGESITIAVSGNRESKLQHILPTRTSLPLLIPEGFWASPKLNPDIPNKRLWIIPSMRSKQATMISTSSPLGESFVSKESTPIDKSFGDLSNYELLCWIGSDSARVIWESFKSIRSSIANHQKPFKFHYYPMDDFRQPDRDWEREYKLKFRKCKNVIVSVDELKYSITQEEYTQQVATFLRHLVNIFDDDSFPIWMLTVNLSPILDIKMCTHPKRRTNHHPCNDALFELFGSIKAFPNRVRLLDNTDLTSPLLEEGLTDAMAVIAMRIFAIAGEQVKVWRMKKQRGTKEGLLRNGKLEPNIDYQVYDFTSKQL
jgi:hypothetical protein